MNKRIPLIINDFNVHTVGENTQRGGKIRRFDASHRKTCKRPPISTGKPWHGSSYKKKKKW